jgi:hypothetical protein
MANWETRLTYVITPKSGPLQKMTRLRDAKQALTRDLPPGYLKRVHWLRAGHAVLAAAETGARRDIEGAFETLVAAVAEEGWFTRGLSESPPSAVPHQTLRESPQRHNNAGSGAEVLDSEIGIWCYQG